MRKIAGIGKTLAHKDRAHKDRAHKAAPSSFAIAETLDPRRMLSSNPTVVTISADYPVAEYDATASHPGQFIVRRKDGPTNVELSVFYSVLPSSTSPNRRYAALAGHVDIAAGATSAVFDIKPVESSTAYTNQTVVIALVAKHYHVSPSIGQATVTIEHETSSGTVTPSDFLEPDEQDETSLTFSSGSYARTAKPFTSDVNFTSVLTGLGRSGSVVASSIRVIEVSSDGSTILDSNTPFQFDQASNYDAATNAAGTFTIMATGTTPANTTRYYEVYFSTSGTFTAPTVTPLVATTDNVMDEGEESVEIQTPQATYYLQKAGGGFSTITDDTGANWLGYNPTDNGGSDNGDGQYRGLPNSASQMFHPGFTNCTTTITASGPLHTQLLVTGTNSIGNYSMTWDIYPTYAVATFNSVPASSNYDFNYEGTPAGENGANFGEDLFETQSNGASANLDTTINDQTGIGADGDGSWLYFGSNTENHYMYLAETTAQGETDSYGPLSSANEMTVFGFGRGQADPNAVLMYGTPATFTIGLVDDSNLGSNDTDFTNASSTVNAAYQAVTVSNGVSLANSN